MDKMDKKAEVNLEYIIDLVKTTIENRKILSLGTEIVKIFDTDPWDFLSYCRQDLNDNSERGRTNALSNAKRAIECRVDEILTLVNLSYFAEKNRWGLPYKLQVIKTFGISAPDVLITYITSKRNILEHEYIKPKIIEEIQYIADITELFLSASDNIVKNGYINLVGFENETKLTKENVNKSTEKWISYIDKCSVNFNLKNNTIIFNHKLIKYENQWNKRTSELSSREKLINDESSEIQSHECKESEIKELMLLILK